MVLDADRHPLNKSTEQYEDFESVTRKSLLHTLAEHQVDIQEEVVNSVMEAYDNLSTFPDVVPALQSLQDTPDIECVVFSNGSQKMINNSVHSSNDLKPVSSAFSQLISVDHMRSFKPRPEVYRYLAECVDMAGQESRLWLVSSNPFDVVGARAVGMNAAWVDRTGNGWQDKLGLEPTKIVRGLGGLTELLSSLKAG